MPARIQNFESETECNDDLSEISRSVSVRVNLSSKCLMKQQMAQKPPKHKTEPYRWEPLCKVPSSGRKTS